MGNATAPVATEKAAELAKAEKLDLAEVKGTGAEGRINVEDVRAAIAERDAAKKSDAEKAAKKAEKAAAAAESSSSDGDGNGADDEAEDTAAAAAAKKTAAKMPERSHLEGCPMPADRVEIYEQNVPAKVSSSGSVESPPRVATMAHCVECGATVEV